MAKQNNNRGSIINKLYESAQKNPDMTMGEILHSIQYISGQRFYGMTDSELYTATETFSKLPQEEDEPMNDNEFNFWIEQVTIIKR